MRVAIWALAFLLGASACACAQFTEAGGGDHGGRDWQPNGAVPVGGVHVGIDTFRVPAGVGLIVAPWDGLHGGRLTVFARRIVIDGRLEATGAGWRGARANGVRGEGPHGGLGGSADDEVGGAGAGGGAGGAGFPTETQSAAVRAVAKEDGDVTSPAAAMGSGGGAAGASRGCTNVRGPGGNGGGAITLVASEEIVIAGDVGADGERPLLGDGRCGYRGGGGGGAGGEIVLQATHLEVTGRVHAVGGAGGFGDGLPMSPACNGYGGGGGCGGRIKVYGVDPRPASGAFEPAPGAGGIGTGCGGGNGRPGTGGSVGFAEGKPIAAPAPARELARDAGIDRSASPPLVDPVVLDALLRGEARAPTGHPFHGRRLVLISRQSAGEFSDGRLPFAVRSSTSEPDREAIVISYPSASPDAAFVAGPGWEQVLEWRKPQPEFETSVAGPDAFEPRDAPTITAEDLKSALDRKQPLLLVFVGVRSRYDAAHIPGAVCVPFEDFDLFFAARDRDEEIVLYCACCAPEGPGVSGAYANRLIDRGFGRVRHLAGHFAAWRERGYPTEP